jgi:hypothetical protein
MKTSNHSSTIGASLIIDGTYVKIYKFDYLLRVLHVRLTPSAGGGGTDYNILNITNQDNSVEVLRLPTTFTIGATLTWTEYVLPLNVKNIVLISNASDPAG